MGPDIDLKEPQAALLLSTMSREVEKVLGLLQQLGFTATRQDRYALSSKGGNFFERVAERHKHLLERFSSNKSQPARAGD
jgi:hypothetical protein